MARLVNWLVGRQQNLCCLFNRDRLFNSVVTNGRMDENCQGETVCLRWSAKLGRTKSKLAFSLRLLARFSVADNWTKTPSQLFPLLENS
ncbi:hypothetical protein Q2T83_13645 [Fervidibacter sacchari]|uniref:hypothetical protein n=1 Tax=Candidatus Fervidibacter sacchari TaxID=1448929 RepID=UPI0021678E46|nr:hypothetical protein [Candidatus Fervidibacter sacchari]WKU15368.1 hypothetical protein Q2T83_13645 [Candidatus Fervidibacter sacchari]